MNSSQEHEQPERREQEWTKASDTIRELADQCGIDLDELIWTSKQALMFGWRRSDERRQQDTD